MEINKINDEEIEIKVEVSERRKKADLLAAKRGLQSQIEQIDSLLNHFK